MARSKKATAEQSPSETPKAGRKGKKDAAPAEVTPKRGRQKDPNLPQPGTPEYKKAAAERAEKFHEKTRAIRDLTRQHGMGVMELAKYCGFPDERGFRPLGGQEIRELFAQAKAAGKVTHAERPAEEWQVRRGRAKAEGAAAKVKKAASKKATTPKASTKSAGKSTEKASPKKTEGRATPKTGKTAGKRGGKAGKKTEESPGSMSVEEAVNAPFSALRDAVGDDATGELEVVVVPDEEVYGADDQSEGTDDMQAEERLRGLEERADSFAAVYGTPETSSSEAVTGGTDAEGFFDTKLGQEEPEAEGERDGTDELAAATLSTADPAAAVKSAFGAPEENGHDTGKANAELAEWLKAQKPESEKVKLAKAFYLNSETAISSRQAAEQAGINVQSNHSGRVVELSKIGFVVQAGEDEKKTRTWKVTDAAIEAWEEVFGVS